MTVKGDGHNVIGPLSADKKKALFLKDGEDFDMIFLTRKLKHFYYSSPSSCS